MRRAASWAAIFGAILVLGSCLSAAASLYRAFASELLADVPVSPGVPSTIEVAVERETRLRVAVAARIRGQSVQEVTDVGNREYRLRYRIPVSYRIARAGRLLAEEQTALDWDHGERSLGDGDVGAHGGSVEIATTLTRIRVSPGPIRIRIDTGHDPDYRAILERMRVEVYQNAVDPLAAAARWLLLLAGGVAALVVALVLWLIVAGRSSAPQTSDIGQASQLAACCHAAGLIGFVIPFGNVIVPLILWLMLRETHAFIDQQGKEAVNFQLSFTCYYLLSLLLVLVLVGIVLFVIVFLLHLTFMILAAVQSYNAVDYRYPLTIRLIR